MNKLSRRDFLRIGLLSLSAVAYRGIPNLIPQFPPEDQIRVPLFFGRVAADYVNIYHAANFSSERLGKYTKDTFVPILAKTQDSSKWQGFNPNWYKTPEGFIHSGRVQLFTNKFNAPAKSIAHGGQLGEVTVGFSQGMRYVRYQGWQKF